MCHGFLSVGDSGERISHAVGCAFAICLEKKQQREKVSACTNIYQTSEPKILNQSKPPKFCFRATLIIRNNRTILITRPSVVIIMLSHINRAPPPNFSIHIFMEANISSRIQWRFITIRRIIRSSGKKKKFHSLNNTGCIFSSKNIPSSA